MTETPRLTVDLAWALQSEPLIDSSFGPEWPASTWFRDLDAGETAPAGEALPARLGLRFERLIHDWLEASPDFDCLEHNLPVRTADRTIGEFDLVVAHAGVIEHWELAVKYYLGTGDQRNLDCWYGPNPTDTLGTKLRRLEQHQMRLATHPAARSLLQARQLQIERVRGFVKGRLFYPLQHFLAKEFVCPAAVNPNHHRGWWCTLAEFEKFDPFGAASFCYLPKSDWLAEMMDCPPQRGKNRAGTLAACVASGRETWHVAVLDKAGRETSRGFIVTPGWLAQTA